MTKSKLSLMQRKIRINIFDYYDNNKGIKATRIINKINNKLKHELTVTNENLNYMM